jgi:purine-nucleoside phosphorylase
MSDYFSLAQFDETAHAVKARIGQQPAFGLILGSGLGGLADAVERAVHIPYPELPHWPTSTVQGHSGQLVAGQLEGQPVLVMQGRAHYYEGYSMAQVGLPLRVMQRLGVHTVIVTNAAGGVNPEFSPGDVMLITDHLNLIGMSGLSALRGPNIDELGPRFPDMMHAYNPELRAAAVRVAQQAGVRLQQGVYAGLAGPNFETPADLRFLRVVGADAVGMSTVPEVIVARQGGMRVLGFSGISNKANLDGNTPTTHAEVLQAGALIVPKLEKIVRGVVAEVKR